AVRSGAPSRLAADEQRRAFGKPLRVLARLLDDERAVEAVRLPDLPDPDSHWSDSNQAVASAREGGVRMFSATNASAFGQPVARISTAARSVSNGVRRNSTSSETRAQKAATSSSA